MVRCLVWWVVDAVFWFMFGGLLCYGLVVGGWFVLGLFGVDCAAGLLDCYRCCLLSVDSTLLL